MQDIFQPLCLIARQFRWPHFLPLTIDERQCRIPSSKFGLRHCEANIGHNAPEGCGGLFPSVIVEIRLRTFLKEGERDGR